MLKIMKKPKENLIIYILIFIMVAVMKVLYANSSVDQLLFILNPVSKITGFVFNKSFEYIQSLGYYNRELGVMISKECSGINYFIVMLSMLLLFSLNRFKTRGSKIIFLVFSAVISYAITIISNVSRIIASIYVLGLIDIGNTKFYNIAHQSIGITVYITYLILVNMATQYIWGRWGEVNEEAI